MPLATSRLTLRRFTEDDASFILRLKNDPDFLRFVGDRGLRTEADAREFLSTGALKFYETHGYGPYAVTANGTTEPLGMCGLYHYAL